MSKSFRMCRSIVLLLGGTMLAAVGFAQSTPQTTSQNSGSNAQKLPPPPTIDVNVNQNETLSAVRYDNKYEVYGGLGFAHLKSGPSFSRVRTWAGSMCRARIGCGAAWARQQTFAGITARRA